MKLSVDKYGNIYGYLCNQCKVYNDILTTYCISCSYYRDKSDPDTIRFAIREEIKRGIILLYESERSEYSYMNSDDRMELHAKFFNDPELVQKVSDMTIEQLIAYEDELETIVIADKATQQRVSHERRQRTANLTQSERDKLVTRPDITGSDALAAPKVRKERMSKMDKLIDEYKAMGLPEEEIKRIMSNISVDESKQRKPDVVKRLSEIDPQKSYTFEKGDSSSSSSSSEGITEEVKNTTPITPVDDKPFNPDELF